MADQLRLALAAAKQAILRLFQSEDFTYASCIAYYSLISLFPFLMLAVSLLGRLTDSEARRAEVGSFVMQLFPAQVDLVSDELDRIAGVGFGVGLIGTVVIGWAALGVFRVISHAVNHAWDLEDKPGVLRHQLVAFAMMIASGVLIGLALVWVSLVEMVGSSWFDRILEIAPWLDVTGVFSSRAPATVVVILVVALVHYFVPAVKVRLRDVWVGAIVTGVLWHLALIGFSWYLAESANLSIHGSLTTVVTFLLWVYVSAVIFLFGVELSAAWARLGRPNGQPLYP